MKTIKIKQSRSMQHLDAIQYNGSNQSECCQFASLNSILYNKDNSIELSRDYAYTKYKIQVGDWLLKAEPSFIECMIISDHKMKTEYEIVNMVVA